MPAKLTPRQQLDADVAKAQRDALAPGKPETEAQRRARLKADRDAALERIQAVEDAQHDEAHRARRELETLTPAERAERIEAGRRFVRERHDAVIAAVDAENRRRAEVIGIPSPAPAAEDLT